MKTTEERVFYPIRLKYLRVLHDMTVTELSKKCECSKQLVSFWETGTRIPKEAHILMLCKIFKVSEEFFRRYSFTISAIGNRLLVNPDPLP